MNRLRIVRAAERAYGRNALHSPTRQRPFFQRRKGSIPPVGFQLTPTAFPDLSALLRTADINKPVRQLGRRPS
jgi:hypothetical protein